MKLLIASSNERRICSLIFKSSTTRDDAPFPGADVIARKAQPFMAGQAHPSADQAPADDAR